MHFLDYHALLYCSLYPSIPLTANPHLILIIKVFAWLPCTYLLLSLPIHSIDYHVLIYCSLYPSIPLTAMHLSMALSTHPFHWLPCTYLLLHAFPCCYPHTHLGRLSIGRAVWPSPPTPLGCESFSTEDHQGWQNLKKRKDNNGVCISYPCVYILADIVYYII